jgi:DNA-binding NtrC family response regulator
MALTPHHRLELVRRIRVRLEREPGHVPELELVQTVISVTLEELEADLEMGTVATESRTLREMSRTYARLLLDRHGKKTEVCRILGITDKTLNRLLRGD